MGNNFIKNKKDENFPLILTLLALSLLIVYCIGFFAPIRGDAVRYAAIGQEMLKTNNYLELQNRGGIPYLQKPPLLFWIISTSFRTFGISHCSFKIPVFLISLLGIFFMYKNARLCYDKRVAALSAIFIVSSFGHIFYQNDIHTDSVIMTTIIFSIWQLNLFIRNKKYVHFVLGFISIGLSMLTKGPIGLAIPVFAFGADILLKRDWKTIFRWEWLAGLAIIAITISPAIIGLYKQFGKEGIVFYFWSNQADRITGALRTNSTDYFYYLHTLFWEFIPWSFFLFYGLFREIRRIVVARFKLSSSDEAINIGGILIFFIVISVSKFKGPNYLIPLFPFFAVVASKWALRLYDGLPSKIFKWISALHYTALSIIWIGVIYISIVNKNDMPVFIIIILFALFLIFISGLYLLRNKMSKALVTATITIIAFGLLFNAFIVPFSYEYNSMLQASNIVNPRSDESTRFIMLNTHRENFSDDTFNFYLKPDPSFSNNIEDVLGLAEGWVFTNQNDYMLLQKTGLKFSEVQKLPHLKYMNLLFFSPASRDKLVKYNYLLKL